MKSQNNTSKRILVTTSPGLVPEWAEEIRETRPDAEFVFAEDNLDSLLKMAPGVNAIINCPRHLFSAKVLSAAGNGLEWLHLGGAGVDEYIIPELVNSGIVFTNGRIIQGPEVSDHAMGLLLCLTRNIHLVLRDVPVRSMPRPVELRGKTAVIIGVGGIGLPLAEKARAFGMRVLGVDEDYVPMVSTIERCYTDDELLEVLPQADVVFMAAPRTENSYQMMNDEAFGVMKSNAIYINVSRGATTDTDALQRALETGKIAAAALDVTDPEPLPEEHPLRAMENVIISPHIAGPSDFNRQRSLELIKINIARFLDQKPLINVVDKNRGY
jgi:phosphoglycerate dehydrogenase-like enzyme